MTPERRAGRRAIVDPESPDPGLMAEAGALIVVGRLVVFPTETVYGLGAHAFDHDAIEAVFAGKRRPPTDPLIVHVVDATSARALVADWPADAQALADSFWPGPLTLVLPRSGQVPDAITAGRDTVAIRVPAHPVARALLAAAGVPIAAPSANRFGRISPTSADHVAAELDGVYDLLLDGGQTVVGVESTVVDLTGAAPSVLRPGGVTIESLEEVIGSVSHIARAVQEERIDAVAPGRFLRHYAPSTPLILVDGDDQLVGDLRASLAAKGIRCDSVGLSSDLSAAARQLYGELRKADSSGSQILLVKAVKNEGLGRAINDRLFRASQGRTVDDASEATRAGLAAMVQG